MIRYFLILAIALCCCPPGLDIDDNGNVIGSPGTPIQKANCASAESNLLRLQCKDSLGRIIGSANQNGEPFHTTCQQYLYHNVVLNTDCLTNAKTCDDVKKCNVTDGGK